MGSNTLAAEFVFLYKMVRRKRGIATACEECVGRERPQVWRGELRIILSSGIRTFDDKVDSQEGNSPELFLRPLNGICISDKICLFASIVLNFTAPGEKGRRFFYDAAFVVQPRPSGLAVCKLHCGYYFKESFRALRRKIRSQAKSY